VGRWPEGARQRLQDAALELFAERGFAATTVDAIAGRAGVSQRTFFRHFRDKEEVLFDPDDRLLTAMLDALRAVPASASPRELVAAALRGLARELGSDRRHLRVRAAVLASDIALLGRDLAKQARWAQAVADELAGRGVPRPEAALLAEAGAAVFRSVYGAWLADAEARETSEPRERPGELERRLQRALDDLAAALR
jgi:AcrR family transcriptional regulator